LLEHVDVRAVLRGGFKELAHLIDEDDEPAAALWVRRRRFRQRLNQIGFCPSAAWLAGSKTCGLHRLAYDADGMLATADDRQDAPSLGPGRQSIPNCTREPASENLGRLLLEIGLAVEKSGQGNDKARLAA